MRLSGRTLAGTAAALLAAVGAPAVAFGCTAVPEIQAGIFNGPALSRTAVSVSGFGTAPVQVHWNTVEGPVLATLAGPVASGQITVPASSPGVYYLIAVQQTPGSFQKAVTSFEVSGPAGAAAPDSAVPAASLPDAATFGGQTSDGLSAVATGLVVLSAGVFVLMAGVCVAELRRRRVTAPTKRAEPR